jgi:hypothetical protein
LMSGTIVRRRWAEWRRSQGGSMSPTNIVIRDALRGEMTRRSRD